MAFSSEIADKQILIEQGQKQNFNLFTPPPYTISNTTNKKVASPHVTPAKFEECVNVNKTKLLSNSNTV